MWCHNTHLTHTIQQLGTGWSTAIPSYNILAVAEHVNMKVRWAQITSNGPRILPRHHSFNDHSVKYSHNVKLPPSPSSSPLPPSTNNISVTVFWFLRPCPTLYPSSSWIWHSLFNCYSPHPPHPHPHPSCRGITPTVPLTPWGRGFLGEVLPSGSDYHTTGVVKRLSKTIAQVSLYVTQTDWGIILSTLLNNGFHTMFVAETVTHNHAPCLPTTIVRWHNRIVRRWLS